MKQVKAARSRGGWKKQGELGKIGVDEFLYVSTATRELLTNYPWFRALLHQIVLNTVAPSSTVKTPLAELTDQDAAMLGKGLVTIILSNTEAKTAVDHWISQNASLGELEAAHPWTRPMFVELAQYSLNTSKFGMLFRVSVGAILSTVDLASDVYMTALFFSTPGLEGYGRTNAVFIGLTMLVQIMVACVQNSSKPSTFLKEVLIVLTGLKPAADAWKVGSGVEKEEHHSFSPLTEMTYCKCTETVFEAIPASIVQVSRSEEGANRAARNYRL